MEAVDIHLLIVPGRRGRPASVNVVIVTSGGGGFGEAVFRTLRMRRAMKLEGRVVIEEFDCEALKGNPLGDPHQRSVPIYLPPGYDRSGRR
jgi:hypothetical protein